MNASSGGTDARLEQLHHIDNRLLGYAVLVLAGIGSSLLARRFGAPLLLVFLILGLLLGVDGPGGIRYDDTGFTYQIGALALCLILFDGGLQTRASQVRGAIKPALVLSTVGVLITASLTAVAAHWLLALGTLQSLLLGTVLASTDAAAVFFLIRARGLHLERRAGSTLEIESGANDPMAVFLTVALAGWVAGNGQGSVFVIILQVIWAMGCGALMGYGGGRLIVAALNRYDFPSGLHPWLAMAGAVTLFALTNLIGGSGYLAVYAAGVIVANRPVRARHEVMSVQDAATWFAQLLMFLLLGLLATPHALLQVLWPALGVAAFLMLVARPVTTLVCLLPFRYRWGEIGFIAWVGLRGAVSIFLASIPLLAQLPDAWLYFNVAFVVVLASLIVQGWTLERAAHAFGVAVPRNDPDTRRVHLDLPGQLEYELLGYRVAPGARALATETWPLDVRVAMVVRDGRIVQGNEAGDLRPGDYAYMLAPTTSARRLDWYFVARGADSANSPQPGFGEFLFGGDAPLGDIAEFYGLNLPKRFAKHTAALLFDERFDEQPQPGDQLSIGNAILTVHRLHDDRVAQVGLRLVPLSERLLGGSQ
ncbi:potassium/proton antiporter [Solilutibacter silvestris]|uniref:NhaP-type Na+/H+ and K+/H+ antiporter with a unique C-terminal domain n=1 Tax=Solilutibacter silvestris TaxID=1645665 RepID=A0A2K1Q1P5_9GAMM|nr:potassium/proton antiporter [Lysobacter silvestris]PNS08847.1 NhaP-type Na+/H+ and K+/H+ antiporter with a unique C-terminal domain [Lysobacter silvestris]